MRRFDFHFAASLLLHFAFHFFFHDIFLISLVYAFIFLRHYIDFFACFLRFRRYFL